VQRFKEALERIGDKYAMYLDPDTLDRLEQLANSYFVFYVSTLRSSVDMRRSMGYQGTLNPFIVEQDMPIVGDHVRVFSELVDIYNREAPDDRKVVVSANIWRDDIAPAVGSSRAVYRRREEAGERSPGVSSQTEQGAE
jgi:hypothetical protein